MTPVPFSRLKPPSGKPSQLVRVGYFEFISRKARMIDGRAAWRQVFTLPGTSSVFSRPVTRVALAAGCILLGMLGAVGTALITEFGWRAAGIPISDKAAPFFAIAAFVPFTMGFRFARGLLSRSVGAVAAHDRRAPVLFLRSFEDDGRGAGWKHHERWQPSDMVSLEELVEEKFRDVGPMVAIGRPGQKVPPGGASRLWLDDAAWQKGIDILLEEAQAIVMVLGRPDRQPGLAWEIGRIVEHASALSKLVLVVPAIDEAEVYDRWNLYRSLLRGALPDEFPPLLLLARPVNRIGKCEVIRLWQPDGKNSPIMRWSTFLNDETHGKRLVCGKHGVNFFRWPSLTPHRKAVLITAFLILIPFAAYQLWTYYVTNHH